MKLDSGLDATHIGEGFRSQGFVRLPALIRGAELEALREAVGEFHQRWLTRCQSRYREGAINSAYLTEAGEGQETIRRTLFGLMGSERVNSVLHAVIPADPAFLNTQLFFNPADSFQHNYWHRDIQYTGMSIEEQREALTRTNVIHMRLALADEPGLELVPGSHRRWDSEEEFAVRMKLGREVHEALPGAEVVPLDAGDLLVFSANMLHRGLYGLDRFALDLLFCDATPELLRYARRSCLPCAEELAQLSLPQVFTRTLRVLDEAGL